MVERLGCRELPEIARIAAEVGERPMDDGRVTPGRSKVPGAAGRASTRFIDRV
jgi:hypothetical protein